MTTAEASINAIVVCMMYEKIVNAVAGGCLNLVNEMNADTMNTFSRTANASFLLLFNFRDFSLSYEGLKSLIMLSMQFL
jgi:hypothetical protein